MTVSPGILEARNVVYDAGTPNDLAQPAAGRCDLVVILKTGEAVQSGVRFTNTVSNAAGQVTGFAVTLTAPLRLANALGPGADIEIPTGQITYEAPNKLKIAGSGNVILPFRSKSGAAIQATVKSLRGQTDSAGNLNFILDDVALKGEALADGLALPGAQIKSAPLDIWLTWSPATPLRWTVRSETADVSLGIPGMATDPLYPVGATVTGLTVDQDGQITFTDAAIRAGIPIKLIEAGGFELTLRGGRVRMQAGVPTFSAILVDLKLPPGFTEEATNAPMVFRNLGVDLSNGFVFRLGQAQRFKFLNLKILANELILDMSGLAAAPGAPPGIALPNWMGVLLRAGSLEIPMGLEPLVLNFANFQIDPQGLTGAIQILQTPEFKVGGFTLRQASGGFELKRGQLKLGSLGGTLNLGTLGSVQTKVDFNLEGKFGFQVAANQTIQLPALGVRLNDLKLRYDNGMLAINCDLGFDAQRITGLPEGLRQFKIGLTDLKVDRNGEFYMPSSGWISFPEPKPIDLGVISVELRRFGFTIQNNQLDSIEFSGGARLNGMGDAFPVKGELDFEGFRIERGPNLPQFKLGGIGLAAEVLGIGELSASLYRENLEGFGDTLYGDASLKLTCLGDMAIGIGLELLLAPSKAAFFIGGNVEVPPILIQTPPTPTSPPVPLFHIAGFSGGFGLNVAPKAPGVGRVSDPKDQLKYLANSALLQAGLLLADNVPGAPGHLWWADATLTLTINPVTIDLTARAAFLDPGGPEFLDLDEFHDLDRIGEIFMNLDLAKPAFTIGGKVDLTFPTRKASLFDAEGQAELKVSPTDSYLRVGWKDAGQKPLKVRFARAFSDVADITAECGLEILLPNFDRQGRVTRPARGGMYFKAKAEIDVAGIVIDGRLKGKLALERIGQSEFSASGELGVKGKIDFGFFSAEGEGTLNAEFNTPGNRDKLYLSGRIRGKAGPLEGDEFVRVTLPVKK
ncbi:MAG TPA: hypothetical protein PLX06_00160 [Fimbriimonadaceae bacterium]|nr:hypothetical protein [Fimbriimonadaceae bacterium]